MRIDRGNFFCGGCPQEWTDRLLFRIFYQLFSFGLVRVPIGGMYSLFFYNGVPVTSDVVARYKK